MELHHLLKRCSKGDRLAQTYFFELYQWRMHRFCRRMVFPDIFTEEVVSNGFLNFFKALDVFVYKSVEATEKYLRKIMKNECLMYLRDKTNFHLYVTDEPEEEELDIKTDGDLLDRLSKQEIMNLIDRLPPNYRAVFCLVVLEGMPHAEVAVALGISETTSRAQFRRSRILLQQLLKQQNKDHEQGTIKRDQAKN